jgi:chromosome segregation ATPase
MVDERTIRSHILALRGLLQGAQERCETIQREVREGRIGVEAAEEEFEAVCRAVSDLLDHLAHLESKLGDRDNT